MRQRPLALCALVVAATTAAAAQEPVLLRLGGTIGQATRSRLVMTTYMRGGPMALLGADSTVPTMRMQTLLTLTLDGISGDTLTFTATIDSMQADSPAMPQLAGLLAQSQAAVPRRSTVRIDTRGHLLSPIPGLDSAAAPAAPSGARPGDLGGEGFGHALPEHAVRVGDSWRDSARIALPGGPRESTTRTEYRLERIEPRGSAGTAVVSMRGTVTVSSNVMSGTLPFAGVYTLDIGARRITAVTTVSASAIETPAGLARGRTEIAQAELGDSLLPPPPVPDAEPMTMPALVQPPGAGAVSSPRPAPADSAEAEGVELSPAPARFTVIRLGAPEGQLNALLAEYVRRARAAGRRAFVEFEADWCGPCKSLQHYLGDARMVEAFAGTYIIKANLDRWQARLAGTGFEVQGIPVFFELDDAGRPTGRRIDGGAWGEDIPQNMAPPLRAFFQRGAR